MGKDAEVDIDKVIEIDQLLPNSVLVVKLDSSSVGNIKSIINALATIQKKYVRQFKEKNLSFLVINKDVDISTVSELDMNHIGWYRQDPHKEAKSENKLDK